MQNDKVLIHKWMAINPITESMITEDCSKKNQYVIDFTYNYMISNFEAFKRNKLYKSNITEVMRIEWIQMIDEYWDEGDTPYSR